MKRVLFVLAVMLLPLSVFAMTPINDNEMSDVTGQAGVTIDVGNMHISMAIGSITYGDLDGLDDVNANAGYINMCVESVPMHINIGSLTLKIDVGSYAAESFTDAFVTGANDVTAVRINFSNFAMALDAFALRAITLDNVDAVSQDYSYDQNVGPFLSTTVAVGSPLTSGYFSNALGTGYTDNNISLGWFGFSNVQVAIPEGNVWIYPH